MLSDIQLLEQFEQAVMNDSMQRASQELLAAVGIKVATFGTVPEQGATLLIPNHPSGIDGMILFAAVNRLDLYQVALAIDRLVSERVNKRILPVYRLQQKRDWLPNIFTKELQSHVLANPSEIEQKNRQSILDAAQLVSDGNAVGMFPEGVAGKQPEQGTWKSGIGYLAAQIVNPATQVVFAKIEGTRDIDLLRLLHPYVRKIMRFSEIQVNVTYANPIPLFELIDKNQTGKMIATSLAEAHAKLFG